MIRAPAITGATELLAILGDPIAHASSPALANERLEARGVDARLVPWHVSAADLPRAVDALRGIRNLRGAIVTMPHKIAVVRHLDRVLSLAASVGAVNVVRRTTDGRLEGTNLDGEGFAAGLLSAGHTLAGRRVHLAGAGGAAVAIAFALAQRAVASISIHNRTTAAAFALAGRLRQAFPALPVDVRSAPDASDADLVVNATSLGMHAGDALPVDVTTVSPGALVAEVVITPQQTALLRAATERGCATHPGRPMLLAQIDLMLDFMLTDDGVS